MKKFNKIIACLSALSICVSMGSFSDMSINNVSAVSSYSAATGENDSNIADYCKKVAELVNQERAKQGLSALTYNQTLNKASSERAVELIEYYSHTRPDGRDCSTIFSEYGISAMKYGENIAMYQETPEEVMEDWMNSTGHRANILNPDYKNIGIGVAYYDGYYYWVQTFGDDIEVSNNVTWSVDNDGTLFVNGTGYMPDKLSLFSLRDTVKKAVIGEDMKSMNCRGLAVCENLSEVTVLNPDCQINNTEYPIQADTIYGYSGSTAQSYAQNKNKSFVTIYSNPYPIITTTTMTTTPTTTTQTTTQTTTTTTATTTTTTTNSTQEKNTSMIYIKTVNGNGNLVNHENLTWLVNNSYYLYLDGKRNSDEYFKDNEFIYSYNKDSTGVFQVKLPDGKYSFKGNGGNNFDGKNASEYISFSIKDNNITLNTDDKYCWLEDNNTLVLCATNIKREDITVHNTDEKISSNRTFTKEELHNYKVLDISIDDTSATLPKWSIDENNKFNFYVPQNCNFAMSIQLGTGERYVIGLHVYYYNTTTSTTSLTTTTTTTTRPTTTTITTTTTTAVGDYQKWTMFEDTIVSIGDDKVTFAERGNTAVMNNGYNMDKIKNAGVGSKVAVEAIVSPSGSILNIISIEVLEKPDVQTGDANGDNKVSVADAVLIMQALANPSEFSITKKCADAADVVNKGDGITSMDALAIQMIDIGLLNIEDLPITSEELQELVK